LLKPTGDYSIALCSTIKIKANGKSKKAKVFFTNLLNISTLSFLPRYSGAFKFIKQCLKK